MPIKQHKFLVQDTNGNWIYVDINNKRVEPAAPLLGTILRNTDREISRVRKDNRRYSRPKMRPNPNYKRPEISLGRKRSEQEEKRLLENSDYQYNKQKLEEAQDFTATALGNFSTRFFPSYWARVAYDTATGNKSLAESWVEGNDGLGHPVTNLAFDVVSPIGVAKGINLARKALNIWNSPLTGRWTTIGNRQYRLSPNSLGADGAPIESRMSSPQITEANAASLTPQQWTAAQDAAIARGDMAEAQRLRDLHFKVSAPNTEITDIQYHGSPYTFNVFDPAKRGNRDQGWFGKGYYFTPSKDYAAMYGETRPFYINAEDVYTKGEGNIWFGKESSPQAKVWLKMQEKRGRGPKAEAILDDLRFSDAVRDAMPQTKPYDGIFEEVVTRNNNQMKLADAVTYDNNGVRVPLGERDNFNINDIRYYESPNREAMKGVKYIEQTPSATSLDAEQQLEQRLKSYTPKVGENGLIEYKSLNSNDVINIPEEAMEKQIQRYIDSGMTREDAIEHLREQFGYGAMTQNGKTFLLPEKYMITNPEYMKAHDAIHRILRFDDSFNIPGAEGLNPNEAVAMISGEIKPALGIQANQPLTEEMLDKWLKTTDNKITGRYGFSSKIKDKKKFLEWVNKVAPTALPLLLGSSISTTSYKKQGGKMYKFKKGNKIHIKESLKGSFTKYCNGKVTEECILKGKNSPNPKIRKKATFAANARLWKHLGGGYIAAAALMAANAVNGYFKTNKAIKREGKAVSAQSDYARSASTSLVMGLAKQSENLEAVLQLKNFYENSDNGRPSERVSDFKAHNSAMKVLPEIYNQIDLEKNAALADLRAMKQLNTANIINNITGLGVLYGLESGAFDKLAEMLKLKQSINGVLNNNQKISVTSGTAPKISTGNIALV